VDEALMIEPTETEARRTLDAFAEAMELIAREIESDPAVLKAAPATTPIGRVDEALAARNLDVAE
jgi:glycine dehydrogenase subunit 2